MNDIPNGLWRGVRTRKPNKDYIWYHMKKKEVLEENRWSIHIPVWSIGWGTVFECSLCDVGNIPLTLVLYWQTSSILNSVQWEDFSGLVSLGQ